MGEGGGSGEDKERTEFEEKNKIIKKSCKKLENEN